MFTVYVLISARNNKRYVGYTSKDVHVRLHEHNSGKSAFTRSNRPFTLLHQEFFEEKRTATKREKFLKSGQGRKFLDSITDTMGP